MLDLREKVKPDLIKEVLVGAIEEDQYFQSRSNLKGKSHREREAVSCSIYKGKKRDLLNRPWKEKGGNTWVKTCSLYKKGDQNREKSGFPTVVDSK